MKGGDKGMGKEDTYGSKGKSGKDEGGKSKKDMLGEFLGMIKSFNQNNGYGFIDCPELKATYSHDVFLHHQQLGDFKQGDEVKFTAYLNNAGKPQAKELSVP